MNRGLPELSRREVKSLTALLKSSSRSTPTTTLTSKGNPGPTSSLTPTANGSGKSTRQHKRKPTDKMTSVQGAKRQAVVAPVQEDMEVSSGNESPSLNLSAEPVPSSSGGNNANDGAGNKAPRFKSGTTYFERSVQTLIYQGKRVKMEIKPSEIETEEDFDRFDNLVLEKKKDEQEISCILNHSTVKIGRKGYRMYKVQFVDKSTEWVHASELKESAPVAVEVYVEFRKKQLGVSNIQHKQLNKVI